MNEITLEELRKEGYEAIINRYPLENLIKGIEEGVIIEVTSIPGITPTIGKYRYLVAHDKQGNKYMVAKKEVIIEVRQRFFEY